MEETKEKIERFVDDAIKKNDIILLDILWTFSYSIPSQSGYHNNKEEFKKWFGRICKRNLQKKYNLKQEEIKEKIKIFVDFLNNMPDFLSKESFDEDKKLLRNILINKTSEILIQNIRSKIPNLSDLDKKILSFVLYYIPIRIRDSVKEAEDKRKEYLDYKETGSIAYFEIDTKEWTHLFNLLFDKELKEQRFKVKSYRRGSGLIIFPQEQHEEYSFWQFGDELVKAGVGYWAFYISTAGNVSIKFIIPNFIYEAIKDCKNKLPIIENFEVKINEIKKEKEAKKLEKEWNLEDFEETEAVSEVLESEIETSIISNPEILEEGLELVGNQYPTPVGYIDILCRDKNGNFVVVELKRGRGSYKVVGQIQKYMAWVSENLAKNKQVRGIIVVKEQDQELEYAVKGSKFPIEIKIFGREPPTGENIKYCTRCGKPNPKSAKYCSKCGQEFWL